MTKFRTFIAIEIPKNILVKIADVQNELRRLHERISWPNPANIHLTIKFLGNVDSSGIDAVGAALEQQLNECSAFSFYLKGLGMFPNTRQPRVLWAGLSNRESELKKLAKIVTEALFQFGFPKENRKFTPHLTLGRVKSQPSPAFFDLFDSINFDGGQVQVNEIVLMKSVLKPGGAVYTPLRRIPLK